MLLIIRRYFIFTLKPFREGSRTRTINSLHKISLCRDWCAHLRIARHFMCFASTPITNFANTSRICQFQLTTGSTPGRADPLTRICTNVMVNHHLISEPYNRGNRKRHMSELTEPTPVIKVRYSSLLISSSRLCTSCSSHA